MQELEKKKEKNLYEFTIITELLRTPASTGKFPDQRKWIFPKLEVARPQPLTGNKPETCQGEGMSGGSAVIQQKQADLSPSPQSTAGESPKQQGRK